MSTLFRLFVLCSIYLWTSNGKPVLDGRIKSRMSPKFKKHKLNPNIERNLMRSEIKWTEKIENFDANKLNMLHKRRKLVVEEGKDGDTVSSKNICRAKQCGLKCDEMASCGYVLVKNEGLYVADLCIDFIVNGTSHCCASGDFVPGQQTSIKTPCGAQGISMTAEAEIFIDEWSQVAVETYPTADITKCYTMGGLSIDTNWTEYICPSRDMD